MNATLSHILQAAPDFFSPFFLFPLQTNFDGEKAMQFHYATKKEKKEKKKKKNQPSSESRRGSELVFLLYIAQNPNSISAVCYSRCLFPRFVHSNPTSTWVVDGEVGAIPSSSDRDAFGIGAVGRGVLLLIVVVGVITGAGLALEQAALLDGAAGEADAGADLVAAHTAADAGVVLVARAAIEAAGGLARARQVRNVLGHGVLAADAARVQLVALAGLGHGVVAAVEVLALLQVLGEVVGLGRQLAIEAEQSLLIGGERLGRERFVSCLSTR